VPPIGGHAPHEKTTQGFFGKGMGKEWERGGGVTGRQTDRVCSAVSPLVCSAFFLRFFLLHPDECVAMGFELPGLGGLIDVVGWEES